MGERNTVYFRKSIVLMHIDPPVTAEGFDGSYHPSYAESVLYKPDDENKYQM